MSRPTPIPRVLPGFLVPNPPSAVASLGGAGSTDTGDGSQPAGSPPKRSPPIPLPASPIPLPGPYEYGGVYFDPGTVALIDPATGAPTLFGRPSAQDALSGASSRNAFPGAAFVLQDWVTLQCGVASGIIAQSASAWADLQAYEDIVFTTQADAVSGTLNLALQTSPAAEDASFRTMTSFALTAGRTRVDAALGRYANPALARYVRWLLFGVSPWQVTFRILCQVDTIT